MESLVKSDIFFFITSIAVIAVTILLSVALVYATKLLREAREVIAEVKHQSDKIADDIENARAFVKREGLKIGTAVGLLTGLFKHKNHKTRKRRSENESGSDETINS